MNKLIKNYKILDYIDNITFYIKYMIKLFTFIKKLLKIYALMKMPLKQFNKLYHEI